jgi:copper oxidase (laccase) domain-containing protein
MTGSPDRLPRTGTPALKTPTTAFVPKPKAGQPNFDLPALNSMRRTALPSRPCHTVGLCPSRDPDAYFDAPSQHQETRKTTQNTSGVGLDRPRTLLLE